MAHHAVAGVGPGLAESLPSDDDHHHGNDLCLNIKLGDKSFTLLFKQSLTIREIKETLGREASLPPHSINLVFAGQLLNNDRTPEDYDLDGHTTLHAFCWSDDGLGCSDTTEARASSSLSNLSLEESGDISGISLHDSNSRNVLGFSRFFVFCKLCDCVRPGLLRVVCKSCSSGLFVVNHGPSCWDDISPLTTLKGRCNNLNCTSETPRFYLRCSQRHQGETGGTAAALCHVQSNCRQVECIICQDISTTVLIFPCPPGHVMCLDCFHQYALSALSERQFVGHEVHGYTLSCPAGCEDSFIEDNHHFLLMGPEKYERYKNFGAEEFVLKNGGVLCPAPSCGMGIFPDNDSRHIRCSECKFESCKDCKRAYHFDTCHESLLSEIHNASDLPMDRERAQRASWESQSLSLIGEIAKACPGCSAKTERNGGCMHIECTRCGAEWCWLCVKAWDRQCQAYHWFGNG